MTRTKNVSRKDEALPKRAWITIGILLVAALAAWLVHKNQQAHLFTLKSGDDAVVILLRDIEDGVYTVQYNGRQPIEITGLHVMLAGEILHMDVESVALKNGAQEVRIEQNRVPEGETFRVEPGDSFRVRITFSGQTLGYNYMYGFRIAYTAGEREAVFDLSDKDFRFLLVVE